MAARFGALFALVALAAAQTVTVNPSQTFQCVSPVTNLESVR